MTYLENLFFGASAKIQKMAAELRANMTLPEKVLWDKLRDRSFIKHKFRRQHPINKFIVDFYCHRLRLAIEVDGNVHDNADNIEYDLNRTFELNEFGITVLRFSNEEVLEETDEVVKKIALQIELIERNRTLNPPTDSPPKSPL